MREENFKQFWPEKSVDTPEKRGKLIVEEPDIVYIEEGVEIDLTGDVTIGGNTEIAKYVKIFTHRHLWNHSRKSRRRIQSIERVDLKIGRDVFIGTSAIIVCVSSIGDGAIIGTGSVLTKDVPPFEVWAGNPARKINERKRNEDV